MDSILSLFFAVGTGVVSNFATKYIETKKSQKKYTTLDEARKNHLKGRWAGKVIQPHGPWGEDEIEYEIIMEIIPQKSIITGKMETKYIGEKGSFNPKFEFTGHIRYGRFINIAYEEINKAEVHYGSMILKISDSSKNDIKGCILHYGAISEEVVTGKLWLRKIPEHYS